MNTVREQSVLSDSDGEEGRPNQDGLVNLGKLYLF